MANIDAFLPCWICEKDCHEDFIAIEKNYVEDAVDFRDVCKECFDSCADEKIKHAIYNHRTATFCIYCGQDVLNAYGEAIHSEVNASGQFCAIMYSSWRFAYLHNTCYEQNINL